MSNIVLYADLLDNILLEIPGCPSVIAEKALSRAARDWYKDTCLWREELPYFTTQQDVIGYLVTVPVCSMLLALDDLLSENRRPVDFGWSFELPRQVILDKSPEPDQKITPVAVLSPSFGAEGVPCSHAPRWIDDWSHGALWYLRMQVNTAWYDKEEAERQRQIFRAAILNSRIHKNAGHRTGDLRVKPVSFT